jgi:CheY-like chemotaxis protein
MQVSGLEGIRVLVVDDERDNCEILDYILRNKFKIKNIDFAMDGEHALMLMEDFNINIVLLDRMLPGISGVEVSKIIKRNFPNRNLVVIMQTARDLLDKLEDPLEFAASHLILKPYTREHLEYFLLPVIEEIKRKKFFQLCLSNIDLEDIPSEITTLASAKKLAGILAHQFRPSILVAEALYQIIANSLEHGVLGINNQIKDEAYRSGDYTSYVDNLLLQKKERVHIKINIHEDFENLEVTIKDPGKGFNPLQHDILTAELLQQPYGKQIAISARELDGLEYNEEGTLVKINVHRVI